MEQLNYAVSLSKRVIPIFAESVSNTALPASLKNNKSVRLSNGKLVVNQLIGILNQKSEFLYWKKRYLVQSLKWATQNRNETILLRGKRLEKALEWLESAKLEKHYKALPQVVEFVNESYAKKGQLGSDVFISYSRIDSDFAREMNELLQLSGYTTWFDQESLASASTNFWNEIKEGIRNSNNFVFVISPDAVQSTYCKQEVDFAKAEGKRILTLNYRSVETAALESVGLTGIQWIDYEGKTDYDVPTGELLRTLNLDRGHVLAHTRWSVQANDWAASRKNSDQLLIGTQLALATEWAETAIEAQKNPQPTALQIEFIEASTQLLQKAKQREQSVQRRMKVLLAAASVGLLLSLASLWWISTERNEKEKLRTTLITAMINVVGNDKASRIHKDLEAVDTIANYYSFFYNMTDTNFKRFNYDKSIISSQFANAVYKIDNGTQNTNAHIDSVLNSSRQITELEPIGLSFIRKHELDSAFNIADSIIVCNPSEEPHAYKTLVTTMQAINSQFHNNEATTCFLFPTRKQHSYWFSTTEPNSTDTFVLAKGLELIQPLFKKQSFRGKTVLRTTKGQLLFKSRASQPKVSHKIQSADLHFIHQTPYINVSHRTRTKVLTLVANPDSTLSFRFFGKKSKNHTEILRLSNYSIHFQKKADSTFSIKAGSTTLVTMNGAQPNYIHINLKDKAYGVAKKFSYDSLYLLKNHNTKPLLINASRSFSFAGAVNYDEYLKLVQTLQLEKTTRKKRISISDVKFVYNTTSFQWNNTQKCFTGQSTVTYQFPGSAVYTFTAYHEISLRNGKFHEQIAAVHNNNHLLMSFKKGASPIIYHQSADEAKKTPLFQRSRLLHP